MTREGQRQDMNQNKTMWRCKQMKNKEERKQNTFYVLSLEV